MITSIIAKIVSVAASASEYKSPKRAPPKIAINTRRMIISNQISFAGSGLLNGGGGILLEFLYSFFIAVNRQSGAGTTLPAFNTLHMRSG